jgi:hypothetical protein
MAYNDCIIPFGQTIALAFSKHLGMDGKTEWLELSYDHLAILKLRRNKQ